MSERKPELSRLVGFLREQAGVAFCFDCLANAITAPAHEVREHVMQVVQRPRSPIDVGRGRCSVCRSQTEVARHKLH